MSVKKIPVRNVSGNSLGFTLLELVVSFGIIGVLSVIGFASFTAYSRSQILDQAATQVRTALEETKFNSLSRVKPSFCLDTEPISGFEFILCETVDGTCTGDYEVRALCTTTDGNLYGTVLSNSFPAAVQIEVSGQTCEKVPYNILHGFEGEPCQIVLQAYSNKKTISVDGTGNVLVE